MDNIDLQIIKELKIDARKPFKQIAEKIGVSTQTVIKRYNEMKATGLIQFCSISVNLEKIGYKGSAHLLITSKAGSDSSETINKLKKTQNIICAGNVIGDFEGYAVLLFKDSKDLYESVLQIKSSPDIENVQVSYAIPGIQHFPQNTNLIPYHK